MVWNKQPFYLTWRRFRFVFSLSSPAISHFLLDGVPVWQPARDAGLPEGVSADAGRENQLISRLHDTSDNRGAQGNLECLNLEQAKKPIQFLCWFIHVFKYFFLQFCKYRSCFPHWADPFCTTPTTLSSTVASVPTISKSRKFWNEVSIRTSSSSCGFDYTYTSRTLRDKKSHH